MNGALKQLQGGAMRLVYPKCEKLRWLGTTLLFILTEVALFVSLKRAGQSQFAIPFGALCVCLVSCLPIFFGARNIIVLERSSRNNSTASDVALRLKRGIVLGMIGSYGALLFVLVSMTTRPK